MTNEVNNDSLEAKIVDQQKYFKWYYSIPLIMAIITIVAFFIMGLIDADLELIFYYATKQSEFLAWLVWMSLGAAVAILEFLIGRILLSQKILTVLYLQNLSKKICDNDSKEIENK